MYSSTIDPHRHRQRVSELGECRDASATTELLQRKSMSKDKSARLGGARRLKAPGAATFQFDRVAHRDVAVTSRAIIEEKTSKNGAWLSTHNLLSRSAQSMACPCSMRLQWRRLRISGLIQANNLRPGLPATLEHLKADLCGAGLFGSHLAHQPFDR